MTRSYIATRALALAAVLASSLVSARADSRDDEIKLLREQIGALDQKLRVLERKQEIKEEDSAAAAKTAAKVTANDRGFSIASADGANTVRIRGLVQADSRWFLNDGGIGNNDAFVLRRARLITEGTFNKIFEYQLVTEFAGSATSILDANVNVALSKAVQIRLGKFKSPIGLEQLQSDAWAFFPERAFPTQLTANRDLGVYVTGEIFDGLLNYGAGIFNGLGDGGSTNNADFDDDKEIAGRVFYTPFKKSAGSFLQGLGVGFAASSGSQETAADLTSQYRTDGQQRFFSYRSTIVQDGQVWRLSPQAYWYNGPIGLLAEYVESTSNPRVGTAGAKAEITNKAWQIAGGYVLTGEDSSYRGVIPKTNFDLTNGTWGAFEVVGRFSELDIDDAAFPIYADAAASATKATAFGLGLNWYLNRTVKFSTDYFHTTFDKAAIAPVVLTNAVIRQDENAIITRLQLTF